jgi:hypothetical protein
MGGVFFVFWGGKLMGEDEEGDIVADNNEYAIGDDS